jgi:DNA-binding response OmpR family regulator
MLMSLWNQKMLPATTIIVARDDFSIPGEEDYDTGYESRPIALEHRFFSVVRASKPDVIVLDLSHATVTSGEMIVKIREQCSVPILVVSSGDSERERAYWIAGAAYCILSPVELTTLNRALQHIVRGNRQIAPIRRQAKTMAFAGVRYRPHQDLLVGPGETNVQLTTTEGRLLAHFVANPWEIHTRMTLAQAVYDERRPMTNRAIDLAVYRLRTKLRSICTPTQDLIKTEFGSGYRFVSDAVAEL